MERKILKALYNGNLNIGEQAPPKNKKYQEAMDSLTEMRKDIPEEYLGKVDEMLEALTMALSYETEENFNRGFSLGIRLINEIYEVDIGLD